MCLILAAPFVYGCQPPWASGLLVSGIMVLASVHLFSTIARRQSWGFESRALETAALLLITWLAINVLRDFVAGPAQSRVPALSIQKLCYAGAFLGAALLGAAFARSLERLRLALLLFGVLGILLSIFAVLQLSGWDVKSLAGWTSDMSRPGGVYTNANRFAVLMACCWMCACAVLLPAVAARRSPLDGPSAGMLVLLGAAVLASSVSIALTLSRLTMLATAVALFFVSVIYFLFKRQDLDENGFERPLQNRLAPFVIPLVMIVGWGAWCLMVGNTNLRNRFADIADISAEGRTAAVSASLPLLRAEPLWGHGLGSFESVFTQVQPATLSGRWREVHSDWLQLAIEAGIPALVLSIVVALCWLRALGKKLRDVPQRDALMYILGAAGIVVVMICSAADFPLREPATAVLVFFIAGALAGSSGFEKHRSPAPLRYAGAALMGLLMLGGAFVAGRNGMAYAASPWMGKIGCPTNYAEQGDAWAKPVAIDSSDPELKFRHASALLAGAAENRQQLEMSQAMIRQAQALQPCDFRFPMLESGIAELAGDVDAAAVLRERATKLAPTNAALREQNGRFYLRQAVIKAAAGEALHEWGMQRALENFRALLAANSHKEAEVVAMMQAAGCLNTEIAQLWPGDDEQARLHRALFFCSNNQWDMAERQLEKGKPGGAREIAFYHSIRGAIALKRKDLNTGRQELKTALSQTGAGFERELDRWLAEQAAELSPETCESISAGLLPELSRFPALASRLAVIMVADRRLAMADQLLEKVAGKSPEMSAQWAELALEAGDVMAASDRARMTYERGMSSSKWSAWYDQFQMRLKQIRSEKAP